MGVHPALKAFFDKCSSEGLTGSSPPVKDLVMVLEEVFQTISGGYIVLDAMDECSEPIEVLAWLQSLPKQFWIFFTSRYEPEGEIAKTCFKISLDRDAKIDEDIGIYLDKKMENYRFKEDLRTEVMETLKGKAQGQ
ncbi:hypothetical protein GYMLUDRAFT_906046 [Collybiopsis luxurians FD-317 M1]|uniref:NACHT domain-containing protein n=1 Tax=Collybiopsis luxurians FD-317 M1 TaxID=944289 RepID=A0A0D0CH51_9AGAR|nr:hypothetical protein GYMLUDRAFT_906046 [Collybiopsis luxurians FD-317 M1]